MKNTFGYIAATAYLEVALSPHAYSKWISLVCAVIIIHVYLSNPQRARAFCTNER